MRKTRRILQTEHSKQSHTHHHSHRMSTIIDILWLRAIAVLYSNVNLIKTVIIIWVYSVRRGYFGSTHIIYVRSNIILLSSSSSSNPNGNKSVVVFPMVHGYCSQMCPVGINLKRRRRYVPGRRPFGSKRNDRGRLSASFSHYIYYNIMYHQKSKRYIYDIYIMCDISVRIYAYIDHIFNTSNNAAALKIYKQ